MSLRPRRSGSDRDRRPVFAAASALILVGLAACGTDDGPAAATQPPATPAPVTQPTDPTPPPTDDLASALDGRTFLSTAVDGQTLVEGSSIRLEFDGEHLGVSPGCNSGATTWSIEGDALSIGGVAMTEMACEPAALMDQDSWVVELLGSGPTLALAGDELTISGAALTITFTDREIADPDRPLEGTSWRLESVITADAVSSVPAGTRVPTLTIADGRLDLDTGCNTGGGDVTVGDGDLTVAPIALTRMACADPAGQDVEHHIATILDGTVAYTVEADLLTLTKGGLGLQYRAEV